jgi:hypothetical protein
MNKTDLSKYVEEVRGVIIGGDHSTGQLFYEGRPQSGMFYGTEEEVNTEARARADKLKHRLGDEYRRLYPKGLELRIFA